MSVVLTPEATFAPGYCSASGVTAGPFIQTGANVRGQRVQISVAWIKSIAEEIGLVPIAKYEAVVEQRDDLALAVEGLNRRVERFDEDVQNVADAMVAFLATVKAHTDVADEVVEAISDVEALAARVDSLEAGG